MTVAVTLERPWLCFDLGREVQVLSWAINRPGFVMANRILWREVRNADLPRDMDVHRWLKDTLAERGRRDRAMCGHCGPVECRARWRPRGPQPDGLGND